jgi:hypothetical protein
MISMGTDNHLARRKPVPMPTVLKAELPTTALGLPSRADRPSAPDQGEARPATGTAGSAGDAGRPVLGLSAADVTSSARLLATGVLFGAGAVFGVGTVVGAAATRRLRRRLRPYR